MKVSVLAKPNSRKEGIEIQPDGVLVVRVNAVPEDGRANERIVELLADHFQVRKSQIELKSGHRGKHKIFEIV